MQTEFDLQPATSYRKYDACKIRERRVNVPLDPASGRCGGGGAGIADSSAG